MFTDNKKMENQIKELRKWATVGIPAIVAKPECDVKMYFQEGRLCLNLLIIETMIGAEITANDGKGGKGDYKIKFNRRLPTATEVAEVATIVSDFIKDVEAPFLARFTSEANSDDMEIPPDNSSSIQLEKVNSKAMKCLIFNGSSAITNRMINPIDCVQLAGIGDELRKKIIRDRVLIAGGIALVIGAGTVIGYNMYKKSKEKDDTNPEGDTPIVDMDDGDMPEVNIDDTGDAPVVELE